MQNKSLYEDIYDERLAICLAENVSQELAKKIAHECAMRIINRKEEI